MIQLPDLRWLPRPVGQPWGDLFMSSTFHVTDGTKFPVHSGYLLISVHWAGENQGDLGYRIYQGYFGFRQVEAAA